MPTWSGLVAEGVCPPQALELRRKYSPPGMTGSGPLLASGKRPLISSSGCALLPPFPHRIGYLPLAGRSAPQRATADRPAAVVSVAPELEEAMRSTALTRLNEGDYTVDGLSTHPVVALNIRSAEADSLATEVASLAGETKTHAVIVALKERRQRLQQQAQAASQVQAGLVHQLDQLGLRCAARAVYDSRTADEILGYDATGLPT